MLQVKICLIVIITVNVYELKHVPQCGNQDGIVEYNNKNGISLKIQNDTEFLRKNYIIVLPRIHFYKNNFDFGKKAKFLQ